MKTKSLKAILSQLVGKGGNDQLWIKIGKDIGGMKVDVSLKEMQVEFVRDAWKNHTLA